MSKLKHVLLKPSIFIIVLLINISLLPPTIKAENVIFQDNFDDNFIGPAWETKNYVIEDSGSFAEIGQLNLAEIGGEIKISGRGMFGTKVVDGQTVGNIGRSLMLKNPINITNTVILESDVRVTDGVRDYELILTIEFDSDNRIAFNLQSSVLGKYPQLVFDENDQIRIPIGDGETDCFPEPFPFDNDQILKFKLVYDPESKKVKVYINDNLVACGKYESILNEAVSNNALLGLATTMYGTIYEIDARFDNFKITTLGEPDSNILNVPDIKQYDPQWGSQEYDYANNWHPSNPTIKRWGCAMTSAAMVLNYYAGFTDPNNLLINPAQLNAWLKNNNGYTRNGAVLWPAVSRYSLLDPNTPTLEFSYLNYSDVLLKEEIEANRPPVLKLLNETYGGNHFIAAKGFGDNDILINDPASDDNNTLSQANSFWGDTLKLGRFMPSETDLSYIVLFINEDFDIKVSSESGEITNPDYYLKEYPMLDPDDPSNTSWVGTLNAFYLPKPDSGMYGIQVQGNGVYQLDYYVYDTEGNVKIGTTYASIPEGDSDTLSINFDKNNSQNSNIPEVSYESVLVYWDAIGQDGHIKSHGLYTSIKRLIENALKNKDKGDGFATKVLLEAVLQKVRFATPQFITEDAAIYFQKQIEILLENF